MHESNEATATMPAPSRDILTEILHDGAQRLLTQAIDAEVADCGLQIACLPVRLLGGGTQRVGT